MWAYLLGTLLLLGLLWRWQEEQVRVVLRTVQGAYSSHRWGFFMAASALAAVLVIVALVLYILLRRSRRDLSTAQASLASLTADLEELRAQAQRSAPTQARKVTKAVLLQPGQKSADRQLWSYFAEVHAPEGGLMRFVADDAMTTFSGKWLKPIEDLLLRDTPKYEFNNPALERSRKRYFDAMQRLHTLLQQHTDVLDEDDERRRFRPVRLFPSPEDHQAARRALDEAATSVVEANLALFRTAKAQGLPL